MLATQRPDTSILIFMQKQPDRTISRQELKELRLALLNYSVKCDVFVFLDSCGCSGALGNDKYELLVGLGAKQVVEAADHFVFREDSVQNRWIFPFISYELKNQIEHLRSDNPKLYEVAPVTLVEPLTVIAVTRDLELFIYGESPDFDLFAATDNSPFDKFDHRTRTTMNRSTYLSKVEQVRHEIGEGNVYELNLCYPNVVDSFNSCTPHELFKTLVDISPVPYAAFARIHSKYLICASPERYLKRKGEGILSQPIKGTIKRSDNEADDVQLKNALYHSEKERAENVMIVDLVRNDLSRICRTGSVQVVELFGIYSFAQVHQMISSIQGELQPGNDLTSIIQATFPMGSMTGAPKIAAMEHIEELEDFQRGWYSGSVGYIEPGGDFDLNVIIRSLVFDEEWQSMFYSVGGAITIDSEPDMEWEETRLKASAIESVLNGIKSSF